MITFVNSSNADSYSLLYSEVTQLLRTHNDEGLTREEAELQQKDFAPILTFEEIDLNKDQFLGFEGELFLDKEGANAVEVSQAKADELFAAGEGEAEDADKVITFYQPESINSLNEFFGHLADIAKVEPRYTRLPLDEDFFAIDLNTRKITVPSALSNIVVQGDEMSEIVYFKVKRYYDAADLYGTPEVADESGNSYRQNPMDIYIQWERKATEEEIKEAAIAGKKLDVVRGVSMPYIIDAESEPGYIIFGWPLSTSITKLPGQVKFSVRFYIYNDGQITYSLSTLNNSITISQALDYDIEYIKEDNRTDTSFVIDNKAQAIIDRYVNSVINANDAEVAIPVFTVALDSSNEMCTSENGDQIISIAKAYDEPENPAFVYTDLAINSNTGYHSEPIVMYVQARTGGDGSLGYYWKKQDLSGIPEKFNTTATTVFLPTPDKTRNPDKTYYYYVDNKQPSEALIVPANVAGSDDYSFVLDSNNKTVFKVDGKTLVYEKYGKAIFDSVGYYYAVATNRVHNTVASTRTPANTKDSNSMTVFNYLKIPGPKTPVFEKVLPENVYLTLPDGETQNAVYGAQLAVEVKPTGDKGLVTYTWEYKAAGTDEFKPLKTTLRPTIDNVRKAGKTYYYYANNDLTTEALVVPANEEDSTDYDFKINDALQRTVLVGDESIVVYEQYGVDAKGLMRYDGEEDTGKFDIAGKAIYTIKDNSGNGYPQKPALDEETGFALGDGIYRVTIKNHLNRYSTEWQANSPAELTEVVKEQIVDPDTGEVKDTGNWVLGTRPAVCENEPTDACVCECRVTHKPAQPIVNRVGDRELSLVMAQENGLKVEIETNEDGKYVHEVENGECHVEGEDRYIYKWYRYIEWTNHVTKEDTEAAENHKYVVDDDRLVVIPENVETEEVESKGVLYGTFVKNDEVNKAKALEIDDTDTFVPERAGIYFCSVTNVYNNTKSSMCSPFFVVSDATIGGNTVSEP